MHFHPTRTAPLRLVAAWVMLVVQLAGGQVVDQVGGDLADRPISEIRIDGLARVQEQLVRNQLRAATKDVASPRVELLGSRERLWMASARRGVSLVTMPAPLVPPSKLGAGPFDSTAPLIVTAPQPWTLIAYES